MNRYLLLLFAILVSGCSSLNTTSFEVGRKEAARLRESYRLWDKASESGIMHVPRTLLSDEARAAGFCAALIEHDSEMLMTFENESRSEGLLFDYASGAQLAYFEDLGYSFTTTSEWDILRFRFTAKKPPNKAVPTKAMTPLPSATAPAPLAHR